MVSMKIGLVSKFGAPDGLCVRSGEVLRGLVRRGHEMHAMTQSQKADGLSEDRIHRFKAVQLNPHFSIDALSAPKMIVELSRKLGIDVLHIQMNSGSTEFLLPYFKKSLPPLVVTFHLAYAAGKSAYTTLFEIAWKASMFAAKKYDHIILVDPSQRPYFERYGVPADRTTVIRNGVNTDLFRPHTSKVRDDETVDFVYVGRLSLDKGVNILLDAFKHYHNENPRSRLTLIGDGMLKFQLHNCVDDGSIRWLGALDHDQIPAILQKMDAFIIPQNIGGLGLSVLEAMSCGLPVVTTGIGETLRLLEDDEGILVRPHNVKEVVDAMTLLGQDYRLRESMGKKCRAKILGEYSWSSQLDSIEAVYAETINSST
jgi:glycosyltransferase involved in cell wall biosynthesis